MDTRCCTPPSIGGGGDDSCVASCRHQLFMNEEDEKETEDITLEASLNMQPSGSFSRPSGSRSSRQTRPSELLDTNVHMPSPTQPRRSPRCAFQPILMNPSREGSLGRTAYQGRPVGAVTSDNTCTPWISSVASTQPSSDLATAQAPDSTSAYLQTPEVQRTNHALSTPNMIGYLLYTPQIPQVCQAWRASLDAELDSVNKFSAPAQQPPVTTLIENGLYIGGFPDMQTVPQLCALGVRHIINCCVQDIHTAPEVAARFQLYNFESYDAEEYLILHRDYDAFAKLVSTILAKRERVFVHCIAGVNRSVTLCAAYLMDRLALNPVEAVRVFRTNGRMRILDNKGFRHQLVDHYLQSVEPHNPSIQPQ